MSGKSKVAFDFYLLKRLLRYVSGYRYFLALAVLLLIIAKSIEAYVPIFLGDIANQILNTSFGADKVLRAVFYQSFTVFGLLTLAYFLDSINVVLKNWIGQNALFSLRQDVYRHIQHLPVEYYNKNAVGSMMTKVIHDVDQINQMFAESVIPLVGSFFLFFSILIGLFVVDWRVACVFIVGLPSVFWMTNHFRVNQRRCYNKIREIVTDMNAFVQEHLMGAMTIRSFGLEREEKKHFDKINEAHKKANIETIHYFSAFFSGIDFVQSATLVAIFLLLVLFAPVEKGFEAGTFFTFSLYVLMLYRPLADLAERYNLLQSAMAAAERIFSVMDEKPEQMGVLEELGQVDSIEFDDVWFAYDGGNWVLKGLSFSISKGESVALVGMTGAGKTTILNLLFRFFDYKKGSIKVNGKEIKEYSLASLRSAFSTVLQDPDIFSLSFADNIRLAHPNISREEIEKVVDFVNLRAVINSFSDGIDHVLNERGKNLSAGQRQLVSLARAVASRRSVIVLDEATANIDSQTEKIIQRTLKKIFKEKTAIVIAHRLSTIQDVDKIVVLHEGAVKEMGSHDELLAKKGFYEKLYRLQLGKMV